MRELIATLQKIMSVVSNQLELLPASEGAVEEMTFVGEEERDDTKLSGDNLLIENSLEIPKPTWKYRPVEPIERSTNHFFRYFLDGSYRHYFLATGLEHDRATPIFLAQIAIVILERDKNGKLSIVPDFKRHQWFLLLAKSRISAAAWEHIQESTKEAKVNIIIRDLAEMDAFSGDFNDAQDLRERGRSKTRHLMSTMEFDIVKEFKEKYPNEWMIKDGLVSFGKYGGGMQSTRVIGVAKNFTSVQKFYSHGGKTKEKQSVVSLLGELPPYHRTTAYEGYGGKTAFWYLRLRKSQQVLYPLFGVIKVEIPILTEQALTTELLDEISGALLAERFVTPYGSDDRWHSHLYPIYQAEHASKQQFYSTEVIQGCINNALRSQCK
ncbi:MAG TPA: hypothetical protein P5028_00195 [Candidatus Marinimicrobia bacterium]|nr:hypothetical protein [Candidatus Neomarinimicrobiota bacterium]